VSGRGVRDLQEVVVARLLDAEDLLDLGLGLEEEVLRLPPPRIRRTRSSAAPLRAVDDGAVSFTSAETSKENAPPSRAWRATFIPIDESPGSSCRRGRRRRARSRDGLVRAEAEAPHGASKDAPGPPVELRRGHGPLELRQLQDLAEEGVGVEEDLVREDDVVDRITPSSRSATSSNVGRPSWIGMPRAWWTS